MEEYPASFCVFIVFGIRLYLWKFRAVSDDTGSIGWEWGTTMPRIRDVAGSTTWPHPLTIRGMNRFVPLPYISDFEEWVFGFWGIGVWHLLERMCMSEGWVWRWLLLISHDQSLDDITIWKRVIAAGIWDELCLNKKVEGGKKGQLASQQNSEDWVSILKNHEWYPHRWISLTIPQTIAIPLCSVVGPIPS